MAIRVHKLAAIDIGSNSIRLLVANVITDKKQDKVVFKKSSLTRLPVRLGADVFKTGAISPRNISRLLRSMEAYAAIMEVHGVERYRACATSAMREAQNGLETTRQIYDQTGINIELINGKEEARIIFNSDMIGDLRNQQNSFLYIDVGGGSTEITIFEKGKVKASQSFRIGTIRLLQKMVNDQTWSEMETWLKENATEDDLLMVGSGGNINRMLKLSGMKAGEPLEYEYLRKGYTDLSKISAHDRMLQYDLNPDRADVITHALRIYLNTMKWSGAERILVPKKGLADGIVRNLFREIYHHPRVDQ